MSPGKREMGDLVKEVLKENLVFLHKKKYKRSICNCFLCMSDIAVRKAVR